jgi:hypothetical protein
MSNIENMFCKSYDPRWDSGAWMRTSALRPHDPRCTAHLDRRPLARHIPRGPGRGPMTLPLKYETLGCNICLKQMKYLDHILKYVCETYATSR